MNLNLPYLMFTWPVACDNGKFEIFVVRTRVYPHVGFIFSILIFISLSWFPSNMFVSFWSHKGSKFCSSKMMCEILFWWSSSDVVMCRIEIQVDNLDRKWNHQSPLDIPWRENDIENFLVVIEYPEVALPPGSSRP